MTTTTTHTLDTHHFALLDRLVQRMADDAVADGRTRAAIDTLTAAAAPDRADRLALRPGEPVVLAQRLAVWALRRVDDATVAMASQALDRDAGRHDAATVGAGSDELERCA